MDVNKSYRQTSANMLAAAQKIPTFLCPSNPFLQVQYNNSTVFTASNAGTLVITDSMAPLPTGLGGSTDFGCTDYFATVYTDIDGDPVRTTYGTRNKGWKSIGGSQSQSNGPNRAVRAASRFRRRRCRRSAMARVQTILVIEDVGRNHPAILYKTMSKYNDLSPMCAAGSADVTEMEAAQTTAGSTANRGVYRWADPDGAGSGVSRPAQRSSAGQWQLLHPLCQ